MNVVFQNTALVNKTLVIFALLLFVGNFLFSKFSLNGQYRYHDSSYKIKKEITEDIIKTNKFSKFDAFNNLAIIKITDKKIFQPLEGYQSLLENYNYKYFDNKDYCILVVSKYPSHNALQLNDEVMVELVKNHKLFIDIKKSIGFQWRINGFSFYNYPTAIEFEHHIPLDKFEDEINEQKILYGKNGRSYFKILFDF